jgi:hypothetical protein
VSTAMIPRPPIPLDPAFPPVDLERFWHMVCTNGPFPSLQQKVMQSSVELAAITGEPVTDAMLADALTGQKRTLPVTASFRSYWARAGAPLRDDAAWLLEYRRFAEAARTMFGDTATIRPDEIYVNAQVPQPVRPGSSHVDIPKFRGMGRREFPVWLLTTMRRSGLFERWRIPVATVVAWFYDGVGGTYTYWPDGPDGAPGQTRHPFANTGIAGENDTMFHRGDAVGPTGSRAPGGLTLDSVLEPLDASASEWQVRDGVQVLGRYPRRDVRVVLSWSAEVCVDEAARRAVDEHLDDLGIDTVLTILAEDLGARGVAVGRPDRAWLTDQQFIAHLARQYRVVPRLFPTEAETLSVAGR